MVQATTGGGNKPLTKDEQMENLRCLAFHLNEENIKLKQQLKNCNLQNVSNRRELLIAYTLMLHEDAGVDKESAEKSVDFFLGNL